MVEQVVDIKLSSNGPERLPICLRTSLVRSSSWKVSVEVERSVGIQVLSLVLHANCGGEQLSLLLPMWCGVRADVQVKAHVGCVKLEMLDKLQVALRQCA